jgi:glycosyltransferase involved in cell wall biosynthesis
VTAQNRKTPSASSAPLLSLVIPAYNEAARIESTLAQAVEALDKLDESWELLIVDDGSSDDTRRKAESFAQSRPSIRVEALPHRGKASAVSHGMRVAPISQPRSITWSPSSSDRRPNLTW